MTTTAARRSACVLYGAFLLVWLLLSVPIVPDLPRDSGLGFQLAVGQQILAGEHPFIDFHISYGPLAHYSSALAQYLAGGRLLGECLLDVVGNAIAYGALCCLLFRTKNRPIVSLGFAAIATLSMSRLWKYFVVLGPVLGLLCAWIYGSQPNRRRLCLLAGSVALTGLLRQDLGVFTFLCGMVAVVYTAKAESRRISRALGEFCGLVVLAASPYLLWIAWKGSLQAYLVDSVRIGITVSSGLSLPFPPFHWQDPWFSAPNQLPWLYSFFFLQPVIGAVVYATTRNRMGADERLRWLTTLVLSSLCLMQATHRSDLHHLLQAIPLTFVLMAMVFRALRENQGNRIALGGSFVWLLLGTFTMFLLLQKAPRPRPGLWPHLEKISVYARSKDDFLTYYLERYGNNPRVAVAHDVRRCTVPDERIVALVFCPQIYYLSGRPAAAGLLVTAPGWYDSPEDQRSDIAKLEEHAPPIFVNMEGYAFDRMPERTLAETHPLLWARIERSFESVAHYDQLSVAIRRELELTRRRELTSCLAQRGG